MPMTFGTQASLAVRDKSGVPGSWVAVALGLSALGLSALGTPGEAAALKVLHHFSPSNNGAASNYPHGAIPQSELLQASDGNFYGTTTNGGRNLCPNGFGGMTGCGTVFRMTPQRIFTTLYSFPYKSDTNSAPNGAFPEAGLIQAKDGYLYGVAADGGVSRCNGVLGCGTLFRMSTSGAFTLLHQFCSGDGCGSSTEGGKPMAHLVQTPSGTLCGTTAEGGYENEGTVFCASTDGAVNTLYDFEYENGTDGLDPLGALLVGQDGATLYGTTSQRGANGGGTVFALKNGVLTNLEALNSDDCSEPASALIFGTNGKLYGTTTSGYGCIISLNTDGTGVVNYPLAAGSNAPAEPYAGLVLGSNGLMYGTTVFGSIERGYGQDNGVVYSFNPRNGMFKSIVDFTAVTGDYPHSALIEGADNALYTTTPADGGSNRFGQDFGTIVRMTPALKN